MPNRYSLHMPIHYCLTRTKLVHMYDKIFKTIDDWRRLSVTVGNHKLCENIQDPDKQTPLFAV